jgi:hypothetical protein
VARLEVAFDQIQGVFQLPVQVFFVRCEGGEDVDLGAVTSRLRTVSRRAGETLACAPLIALALSRSGPHRQERGG